MCPLDFLSGMMSQSGKGVNKFLSALDKVTSCDELLKLVKKQNIGDNTLPGFMVSTKMPSFKEKGQRLEGSIISLTGDV